MSRDKILKYKGENFRDFES